MALAAASKTNLSVRDRKAYSQLFSEVDLTVLQFKTLLTSDTLEWIELNDGEQVDLDGEYMYWLYSGEISSSLQESKSDTDDSSSLSHRIFGEIHFAKALEVSRSTNKKSSKSNKVKSAEDSSSTVNETLTAGSDGAVMLRMSTPKLLKLMHHDDQLYDSINGLVLSSMQEKLTRTLHKPKSDSYHPNFSSLESKQVPNVTMI